MKKAVLCFKWYWWHRRVQSRERRTEKATLKYHVCLKKRHGLLPQMIFRTVQQLIEREEVNEPSLKLSVDLINMNNTSLKCCSCFCNSKMTFPQWHPNVKHCCHMLFVHHLPHHQLIPSLHCSLSTTIWHDLRREGEMTFQRGLEE